MDVTFSQISSSVGQVVSAQESSLATAQANLTADSGTTEMMNVQTELQKWTLMSNLQSTIIKDLSDALKGIVQKM